MGEHDVHESMVGGINVLKVEGHDIVILVVVIPDEDFFGGVHGIRLSLFISRVCIHQAQHVVF